ncbi:hypothetical protein OSK11_16145, partial [Escherichia coli]|nr:hypothetical protein [Escherichia coli]MDA6321086.1 hypothetical protein [Escherichia coli]
MMSLWDALRMNMMISYQELVRTFLSRFRREIPLSRNNHVSCMDVDKKLQELKNMIAAWREQK